MPDTSDNLDEWKETRSVLARFDENLHDVRKYGFTFLAALFTIDSLQTLLSDTISDPVRLGMILITITFIVTLWILDLDYQKYQQAAAIRAKILETMLNFELSETISYKYKREKMFHWILYLYLAFVFIAVIIGFIIISAAAYILLMIGFALVGAAAILYLSSHLTINLFHADDQYDGTFRQEYVQRYNTLPKEDWILDKVSCKKGDLVKITFTNLNDDGFIEFDENTCPFEVWPEGEKGIDKPTFQAPMANIDVPQSGNYSWLWDTTCCTPNKVYRIWPRGWSEPLKRSVAVYANKPDQSGNGHAKEESLHLPVSEETGTEISPAPGS